MSDVRVGCLEQDNLADGHVDELAVIDMDEPRCRLDKTTVQVLLLEGSIRT